MFLDWVLQKFLWTVNVLASALVVWRLYSTGLYRTYRFFFIGLALEIARSAALYPYGPRTAKYYAIWKFTQPVLWLSNILIISELYSLVLKHYRGIYSLGRWFFFAAVAASAVLSAVTVLPTVSGPPVRALLYYYALIERGVATSLAIFLLLLMALVAWFPVPMSRNLLIHCSLYSAYFMANNAVLLHWQLGNTSNSYRTSLVKMAIRLVCLSCWALFLSRSGESRTASLRIRRSAAEEKRLLGQLESFNATLQRSTRK